MNVKSEKNLYIIFGIILVMLLLFGTAPIFYFSHWISYFIETSQGLTTPELINDNVISFIIGASRSLYLAFFYILMLINVILIILKKDTHIKFFYYSGISLSVLNISAMIFSMFADKTYYNASALITITLFTILGVALCRYLYLYGKSNLLKKELIQCPPVI